MRLLVACSQCRRQFDASGLDVGERFVCACGAMLEVQAPVGHDASVVRCSSCGAPREGQAASCSACGSDFTLHEQDLHTVCPACLARVSDRAKFCHHCGGHLAPAALAGRQSPLECPACESPHLLRSRSIGSDPVNVMECGGCAGFWLGNATFEKLLDDASQQAIPANSPGAAEKRRAATSRPDAGGKWRYRRCPDCGDMMPRRNVAGRSGIIVDQCRDHGVWFDIEELPRLLAWVRAGGMQTAMGSTSGAAPRGISSDASSRAGRAARRSLDEDDSNGYSDNLLEIGIHALVSALARFLGR